MGKEIHVGQVLAGPPQKDHSIQQGDICQGLLDQVSKETCIQMLILGCLAKVPE